MHGTFRVSFMSRITKDFVIEDDSVKFHFLRDNH